MIPTNTKSTTDRHHKYAGNRCVKIHDLAQNGGIVDALVVGSHLTSVLCMGRLPKYPIITNEVPVNLPSGRPQREHHKSGWHAYDKV